MRCCAGSSCSPAKISSYMSRDPRRACATSPSRSGSSPIASRISRTARSMRSVSIGGDASVAGYRVRRAGVGRRGASGSDGSGRIRVAAAVGFRLGGAPTATARGGRAARGRPRRPAPVPHLHVGRRSPAPARLRASRARPARAASRSSVSRLLGEDLRRGPPWARVDEPAHLGVDARRHLVGVVGRAWPKSRPRNTSPCGWPKLHRARARRSCRTR